MCNSLLKYYFLSCLLTIQFYAAFGQDIMVKANGSKLMVNLVEITVDSIKFTNAYTSDDFIFSIHKSDVKSIEYLNGDIEYFDGSYQNLSLKDTMPPINQIDFDDNTIVIDHISISLKNLFTQHNLIFDFTNFSDTNFIVDKGKLLFEFENDKKNFNERIYPTDEKIAFAKFVKSYPSSEKHFIRLSELEVVNLKLSFSDTVINLQPTASQSEALRKVFLKNQSTE